MMVLLGAILVVGALLTVRWFMFSDPTEIKQVFRIGVVLASVAAFVAFLVSGRFYAFLTGMLALLPLLPFLVRFFKSAGETMPGVQPASVHGMSTQEALSILGLQDNPTTETIKKAHRKLLSKLHPDKGGSNYLTSKINQARDVLLG